MARQRRYAKRVADPLVGAMRQRRLALGWTQAELAERLRVPQSRIGELELGDNSPTLATLRRFAEALDCDLVLAPRSAPPPQITDEMVGLTPRQCKALELTRLGMSARQIGLRLQVSARTVQRWRAGAGEEVA